MMVRNKFIKNKSKLGGDIVIIFIVVLLAFIGGCSNEEPVINLDCKDHLNNEKWDSDCNTCICQNGTISCSDDICEKEVQNETSNFPSIEETLNILKFNSNLTQYERDWLSYYDSVYPNSRIYHIKTKLYLCEGCYDLYYKKDREILKVKVRNFENQGESVISADIAPEIENADVCMLFGGTWNDCPRPCSTDEIACTTMCNPAVCEFDENKIVLKTLGEQCGGLTKGDCEFGLTCYYNDEKDEFGICKY